MYFVMQTSLFSSSSSLHIFIIINFGEFSLCVALSFSYFSQYKIPVLLVHRRVVSLFVKMNTFTFNKERSKKECLKMFVISFLLFSRSSNGGWLALVHFHIPICDTYFFANTRPVIMICSIENNANL